jgi:hypothetical protein
MAIATIRDWWFLLRHFTAASTHDDKEVPWFTPFFVKSGRKAADDWVEVADLISRAGPNLAAAFGVG